MIKNPRREERIYHLWKKGLTIDYISLIEGIPRSSVGYYVKKFNKIGPNLRALKVPQESESGVVRLLKVHLALFFLDRFAQMIEGEFREMKETIESYFALEKFIRNLTENAGEGIRPDAVRQFVYEKLGLMSLNETVKWLITMESIDKIIKDKS